MSRKPVRQSLINEIRKNFEKINVEYESKDSDMLNVLQAYKTGFKKLTGTKNKKKIATGNLSRFNIAKLQDILEYQKKFFANPYTSSESRQHIFEKALEKSKLRYDNLNADKYVQAIEVFSSGVYNLLFNLGVIKSDQVMDSVSEQNMTGNDITDKLLEIADSYSNNDSREDISESISEKLGLL